MRVQAAAQRTILKKDGTTKSEGQFVQVSRLGNPLINEVVIPLGQKDMWNRSEPEDDSSFANRYTTPEVAHLQNVLYGARLRPRGRCAATETGRTDLSLILLTGVPGLNFTGATQVRPAAPEHGAQAGRQRRVPGRHGLGRGSGPPRGAQRRPLRVPERPPARRRRRRHRAAGDRPGVRHVPERGVRASRTRSPNNLLGDGVDANDVPFSNTFPYVAAPHQGYDVP